VLGSGTLPLLELREGRRGAAAGARDAGVLRCVSDGARVAGSGVVCGMGGSSGAVDCGGGLRRGLRRDGCETGGCGGVQVRRWDGWMRWCGGEEDAVAADAAW
jgi:hypothetical protein